jgi:oligosaccharyl transferase (archaeosortase A-associated)
MNKTILPDWVFSLITCVACIAIALYLRIALPYASIFAAEGIKLTGIDSYYYMRLVDNLVHNFPQVIAFDPYMIYPGGDYINRVPTFYAFMLAGLIKLLGGATPGQQVIDSIAVYLPPILGALSTIPLFFIGRALVNKWAGLAAAFIMAIMPGELLGRSLLGFTDHHIAEVFFTTYFAMFFILAIKHGRQFTYDMLIKRQFPAASKHIPYSFIAGLFLGFYLITWQGALFFIFIIFVYFIIQFINDYLHGFPSDYLSKIAITCFLFALLIFVPVSRDKLTLLALAAIILVPIALNIISAVMRAREVQPVYFLAVVAATAVLACLATWLFIPAVFTSVLNYLSVIFTWKIDQTLVGEMKPLLFAGGIFSFDTAWMEYGLILYTAIAGLIILTVRAVRKGLPEHTFTAVWCLIMLMAALAMIRFTYYFGVCAALLTGYLFGWAIEAVASNQKAEAPQKSGKKGKKSSPKPGQISAGRAAALVMLIVVMVVMLIPGTVNAVNLARKPSHIPPAAWTEAMNWMKKNSPEPFGKADFYYDLYRTPEANKGYDYPGTAYSVMIWSDYGYWLVRMGHRIPVANPAITNFDEALFYTAQDEASAGKIMQKLGSRFVVIDNRIVSPNDKFYAVANKSNKQESDYYELCWQVKDNKYVPVLVFYPSYYRTMLSRLYNFDGVQVTPQNVPVMAWEEKTLPNGQKFKLITGIKNYKSCTEAETFIASDKSGRYSIIGTDPLVCPVPLEQLSGYKTIYQSSQKASAGSSPMPEVKIFEYNPVQAK